MFPAIPCLFLRSLRFLLFKNRSPCRVSQIPEIISSRLLTMPQSRVKYGNLKAVLGGRIRGICRRPTTMPVILKQCPLALSSRTLAAWVVVVLAVSCTARSSQAGVIVGDDQSIGAMACRRSAPPSGAKLPQAPSCWQSPKVGLALGQTGSGFGTSNTVSNLNGSSSSAVVATGCEPSPPELASSILGEGPLFFRAPPVFELLRPPRA